jgi:hypothetical protein
MFGPENVAASLERPLPPYVPLGEEFMKMLTRYSLALLLCCTMAPAALAGGPKDRDRDGDRNRHKKTVPEGGSALVYLSFGALVCGGAIALRSRKQKAELSA